jgi:hypothetical protein
MWRGINDIDIINILEEYNNLPTLKEIRVNPNYLPVFLDKLQPQMHNMKVNFDGIIVKKFDGIPLIHDKTVKTYKLVFEGDKNVKKDI